MINDFSNNVGEFKKQLLKETNNEYIETLRKFKPKYFMVWIQIIIGFIMLISTIIFIGTSSNKNSPYILASGSIVIGYIVHYLILFTHEAAHFGLSHNNKLNDICCNILLSWISLTPIGKYRKIYNKHHKYFGQENDSEVSYTNKLNLRFILSTLFFIYPILTILRRNTNQKNNTLHSASIWTKPYLFYSALVHFSLLYVIYINFGFATTLTYFFGVFSFFPLFGALRQLLEHRPIKSNNIIGISRLFKSGPIGSTFGAAGFNRHLLHHLEPNLSYTNLNELEKYLSQTSFNEVLQQRKTTYFTTFLDLWGK